MKQDMRFPKDDLEFIDTTIKRVTKEKSGWAIERADGWSFWISPDSPVTPREGMVARFYGGTSGGSVVRGVFLDAQLIFYRTIKEQKEFSANALYGKDIHEWIERWDANQSVWSIAMGGIGPGYEQAIQVLAVECVRHFINSKANWWDSSGVTNAASWAVVRKSCDPIVTRVDKFMGFSGAQVGAAIELAAHLYRKGPRACLEDESVKDRHILVSKAFPALPSDW